jgi:hypothetical protein
LYQFKIDKGGNYKKDVIIQAGAWRICENFRTQNRERKHLALQKKLAFGTKDSHGLFVQERQFWNS